MAKRSKSEMEILDLLQRFDAVLAIVRKVNSPDADKYLEITGQSLRQIRAQLRMSPRPVPLAKVLTGLRQGLRELPLVFGSVLADASPSDRERIAKAINGSASPAFLQEQDKARDVMRRGVIRAEEEWYVLRWRLDQIEAEDAHQQESTLLRNLLDAYAIEPS
jgi:hypothetical protein